MSYAEGTRVPVERSRAEIERILTRYGATRFGSMNEPERATIVFEVKGRQVRIPIPMPSPTERRFTHHRGSAYRRVSDAERERRVDAERRRRWRVCVITVKSMLEAIESGLMTFDQAFLAFVLIPGQGTIGEAIVPRLDAMYAGLGLRALTTGENHDSESHLSPDDVP